MLVIVAIGLILVGTIVFTAYRTSYRPRDPRARQDRSPIYKRGWSSRTPDDRRGGSSRADDNTLLSSLDDSPSHSHASHPYDHSHSYDTSHSHDSSSHSYDSSSHDSGGGDSGGSDGGSD